MIKNLFAFVGAFLVLWALATMAHIGETNAFGPFAWRTVIVFVIAAWIGFKV